MTTKTTAFEDAFEEKSTLPITVDAGFSTRASSPPQLSSQRSPLAAKRALPDVDAQNVASENADQNTKPKNIDLRSSSILNLQVWLESSPFRPSGAWTVIAGVLALGYPSSAADFDLKTIALLLLLADPLWGSIWRLGFGRKAILALRSVQSERSFWLPYLSPNSPASQLMATGGVAANSALPLLLRVVFPSIAMTTAVALVLGLPAVWMTIAVVVCSLLAWLVRHNGQTRPYLLYAVVVVALPWGITLNLLSSSSTAWASSAAAGNSYWNYQVALLLLWTLHVWGQGEVTHNVSSTLGVALLLVADIGIGVLLIVAKVPLWLLFISILWLPTWFSIYQQTPMQRVRTWWLIAMLMSAVALGQGFV